VTPACLDHADLLVGEIVHHLVEDVGLRHEVGVEDEDELALRLRHAILQRTRLETGAVDPVDQFDVKPLGRQLRDLIPADIERLVRRVI
jgi:hypothetical protein